MVGGAAGANVRSMPIPPVLSLVTLGVTDVAASTRFYESLGFPLSSASVPGEVSFFRTAGGLLGIYGVNALAADARLEPGTATGFRGATFAINLASREAVDEAIAGAEAAGARVLKPAQETEWGGYHAYFADPDGHAWEIAHNPFWPLDEAGVPRLPE
jgi:catechol 2,3-dioxygenase-like lactoylglutathione lyase family enzyme